MSVEFVDSNIVVYAHDVSSNSKHARSRELIERLWTSGRGALSVQVLQETYVTLTRKAPKSLSPRVAIEIVEELSAWPVHVPAAVDVIEAARLAARYQLSFWDGMIIRSALESGAETLWSEDLQHGMRIQSLRIASPFMEELEQ